MEATTPTLLTVSNAKGMPPAPASLPEFKRYTPKAGHPDWPRLQREARELAVELLPTLERPANKRKTAARRLQSILTMAGNFRFNRRLAREGREDLRPLYFIWTTTRVCNFTCTYCDDHQGRKYPDLPNDGVLDTAQGIELLKIMRTRTPSVYFAGGEPMARKDLPELTRAARDLNYYPIIINTNGSLVAQNLKKAAWKTWLADTDIVVVSLDALDLELLGKMWVTKRAEDVIRNLLLLRDLAAEMNFKLMVNTVIQPETLAEASDVLDLVNDLGIWFCPVPQNVGPRVHGALHKDPAYLALAETILARKREGYRITGSTRMVRRLLYSEPLNCRNTLKPHVDFDGQLVWPCKSATNTAPVKIDVRDFAHVDALYDYAVTRINPTKFHGPAANQCGADCNWAQNYTTDAYAHGLRQPLSLIGEVAEFLRAR
jgi:MoaA/NifB/PqqE/SkfB family radical SAM enzyme